MNKLMAGALAALLIAIAGTARAQCGSCAKAGGEQAAAQGGAKMTCPCMCLQGITLTAEQKAKVDAMQAKCKDGCAKGCCKACAVAMKEILTPEQQKQWQANMAACKKGKGGCCAKPEAPKAEEKK